MGKARIDFMRSLIFIALLACAIGVEGQSSNQSTQPNNQTPDSASSAKSKPASPGPNTAPPRSDRIDASALADDPGESSSKDTQIDISPPPGDDREHPQSSNAFDGDGGVMELRPWDPHKAAKDIEVGDFYFKRQNYVGAESRYREALMYKENDATATFKLAESLVKLRRFDEAREEYESYLKLLPNGPEAPLARKAIDRLNGAPAAPASARQVK